MSRIKSHKHALPFPDQSRALSVTSAAMSDTIHTEWRIDVGEDQTTAELDLAENPAFPAVFVCAHGAGGHMADRGIRQLADLYRSLGVDVVRFNFLYKERRQRRPDPMPLLKDCFTAVITRAREETRARRLFIGGRSMGGRAASMLAADGFACEGLVLLAYPLHPPGRPEQLRDAHLPAIKVPVLCFNGTRDTFCRRDLMESVLERVGRNWEMHWLEGADHGFHVPKSSGRTEPDVLQEIRNSSESWLARLNRGVS
jgi:predicted alpha/beta-hydrolase family hydrolase